MSKGKEAEVGAIVLMIVLAVLGTILLLPVITIVHAWILTILWGWFIAEPWGIPQLHLAHAAGLSALVGFMTKGWNTAKEETDWSKLGMMFLRPLVVLGIGYVAHLCM